MLPRLQRFLGEGSSANTIERRWSGDPLVHVVVVLMAWGEGGGERGGAMLNMATVILDDVYDYFVTCLDSDWISMYVHCLLVPADRLQHFIKISWELHSQLTEGLEIKLLLRGTNCITAFFHHLAYSSLI